MEKDEGSGCSPSGFGLWEEVVLVVRDEVLRKVVAVAAG